VLTVEIIFHDLDLTEFSNTLFESNMAVNLGVLNYQIVIISQIAGSVLLQFEVQPPLSSTNLEGVDAMVTILTTKTFAMDALFKTYDVLAIVMPYEATESTSKQGGDNTMMLVLVAIGVFVAMAAIVCCGVLLIRVRGDQKQIKPNAPDKVALLKDKDLESPPREEVGQEVAIVDQPRHH